MIEPEPINKKNLNKDFHQIIGGGKRYDLRFYDDPKAEETRNLIIEIKKKRQFKDSVGDLAKEIGIGNSTLSLAIGGRAGKKPQEKFEGMNSTDFILSRLKQITEEK